MEVVVDGNLTHSIIALWNYISFLTFVLVDIWLQRHNFFRLESLIRAHSIRHERQSLWHNSLCSHLFSFNQPLFSRIYFINNIVHLWYRSFSICSLTIELTTYGFLTRWYISTPADWAFSLGVTTCNIPFSWRNIKRVSDLSPGWFLRSVFVKGSIPGTIAV